MKGISYPNCFALVSGGKDSLTTAQVLHEAGKLGAVVVREKRTTVEHALKEIAQICIDRHEHYGLMLVSKAEFDKFIEHQLEQSSAAGDDERKAD